MQSSDRKTRLRQILALAPQQRSESQLTELVELLGDVKMFEEYKYTPKLKQLCKQVSLHSFGIKQVIFKQGDEADAFYIILSGRVSISAEQTRDGKTWSETVAELKEDDTFGELGLIYGTPRAATAISTTYVELIGLSKEAYDKEIKGDDIQIKTKAFKYFRKHPFFSLIPDEILRQISNKAKKPIEFKTNDIISKQGSKADAIYFITQGSVKLLRRVDFKVVKNANDVSFSMNDPKSFDYSEMQIETKLVEVEHLTKGDFVGAYESFRNLAYQCSAIATMPTAAYKVNPQDFRFVDAYDMQEILNMTSPCPSDKELRRNYIQGLRWGVYKNSFVNSVRLENKFKRRFTHRTPPIKSFKTASLSLENPFSKPNTHLRLLPIERIMPTTPSLSKN
ncbi:unnamed protein product [Blepharisma stoltei]|uniref:Cyclic nucleotide-binding domain-containing protein n=1 Tax=Blepharisma stoltei TaxID=1481888 RepID=A0AAU9ISY5_9CILI|nr:unnamed protein product [Blepharisma stoltei]